jgi:phage terminase large subunit-like protein
MATITADPARSALSAGYEGLLELAELVEYPLEPFQKRIARAVVGPEREALILVARGNAKTTLMALVALHELISNPEAKIYFVAASVPQARIAFEAAADFARRLDHPNIVFRHLELRWCPDPEEPTRFTRHMRVLGAEGPRLHGLSPSLMVLDELQAITRADIYPALASALHKTPTSKLITISTAGAGVDTPLGQLRARALGLPDVRRAGARVDCRGRDLRALLWEVPPEASVERMAEVKKANPASWLSSSALREQRGRLADLDFRRFVCNQWASGATSWLPAGAWQSCAGDVGLEDGEKIWVGLDVGGSEADTAVCWVNADLDVGVQVFSGDEGVLHAKDLIEELAERYAVQELAYDPWRARQLALELEQRRIRCIEFAQSAARMCPASEALYRAVVEGRLTHPGDSELDRHVAAAVAKSSPRGWQLAKAPGGGNVDAVIARDGRVARGGAAATTGTTDRLALNGAPLHRLRDVDRRGLPVSAVQLEGEAGLLGRPSTWEALAAAAGGRPDSIAFPRNYKARGRFYAFYTDSVGIRVAELRRSRGTPDRADPASRRILLTVPYVPAAGHFGGQLQVGPDGRLYISIGDGGPQEDPNGRA